MTRNTRDSRLTLSVHRRHAVLLILAATLLCALAPMAVAQDAGTEAAEVDTVALAALTPEELFLRASSAALQFAPMIQPSRRILVRDHERSLPYLVTQLDTDGPRERHALEAIMVEIGEPAVEPLIDALGRELKRTDTLRGARMAAGILGRLGDDRATPALNRAAWHEDWKVRSSVASAIGRVGSPDGLQGLLQLLSDENEIVRKSSAVAIRRMATEPEPTEGPEELDQYRRALEARGATTDEAVVRALIRSLGDEYYHVRYSGAAALTEVGAPALPLLLETARAGQGPERLVALSAIGGIGDSSALGPLTELLLDNDWAVRGFAAEAIGGIVADRRARKSLSALLATETHPFVIMRAGDALAPMQ